MLEAYHSNPLSGHFGRYKTQKRLMEVAFWPYMWRDVSEFVKNCVSCQQCKPECCKPAGLLQQTEAHEPWELLGVDLMGPLLRRTQSNTQLMVVVDYYSHWVDNCTDAKEGNIDTVGCSEIFVVGQRSSIYLLNFAGAV